MIKVSKNIIIVLIIAIVAVGGFIAYKNTGNSVESKYKLIESELQGKNIDKPLTDEILKENNIVTGFAESDDKNARATLKFNADIDPKIKAELVEKYDKALKAKYSGKTINVISIPLPK